MPETNKIKQIVEAIQTIQAFADLDNITMNVEQEMVARKTVGGNHASASGREILVIRIPFSRQPGFLQAQLTGIDEEIRKLKFALTVAAGERAALVEELESVSSAKTL